MVSVPMTTVPGMEHSSSMRASRTRSRTTSLRFLARPRRATSRSKRMSKSSGMATENRMRSFAMMRRCG